MYSSSSAQIKALLFRIEITCVLLDAQMNETINAKRYSPFSIKRIILAEVKKTYPGVERIRIFVSRSIWSVYQIEQVIQKNLLSFQKKD